MRRLYAYNSSQVRDLMSSSLRLPRRTVLKSTFLPDSNYFFVGSKDRLDDRLRCPGLPLAVYREVAAHLCQVDGVAVELIPQQSQQFDYRLSQVDSLRIQHPSGLDATCHEQVQQILAYYSDRYGAWEPVTSDNTWV